MARYQYAGPGPVTDPEGTEIIRPGDVREFGEEPTWGPWEPLDEPAPEPAATPVTLTPAVPPAIGLSALTTPPAGKEGM